MTSQRGRRGHALTVKISRLLSESQVLAPKGLQIWSEFRHSERQVVCTLKSGAAQRTVFWREAVKLGGTVADA